RGVDDAAASLLVTHQPFAALGHPADRAPDDLGRPQRQPVFGIASALHAEATAHIVADHPELVMQQFEDAVGECGTSAVHRLHGAADRVAVLIPVVIGETAARLH